MTKQADFKRRVRARAAKTGESYTAARAHLAADPTPHANLHVTNGDSTVPGLRGTGITGPILVWRDVLHEGPVPNLPDAELRQLRASFLDTPVASFIERDTTLAAHRDGNYVLWFEADLYDQLQLIQILARLRELAVAPRQITLICVGEYPGIAHFGGLGELRADQLGRLPELAMTMLTGDALDYAATAWSALRAPDPTGLREIAARPNPVLRFVSEAFDRLGREYPARRDGLALTERRILAAVAEGASTAGAAFTASWRREARPFLGDTWCLDRIARLTNAPHPLLEAESEVIDQHTGLALTDTGRRVLDGKDDHVTLNGVDRWIGGVHLTGRDVAWRWDDGPETIVAG